MVEPVTDRGRELPVPEEKTIGFVENETQLDAIVRALNQAGYSDIRVLHGQDGINLLERLRELAFFGDWERAIADKGISELEDGHYALAVKVKNRDDAVRVADIAELSGGHTFNYFGKWFNEQLTK
jgi:hypothetical protein